MAKESPIYIVQIISKTGIQVGYAFKSLKKAEQNLKWVNQNYFANGTAIGHAEIVKTTLIE